MEAITDFISNAQFCKRWHAAPKYLDILLVACLSAPHYLYAFIWFRPHVFANLGYLGKVVQFAAIIAWVWAKRRSGLCLDPSEIELWQWLLGITLIAYGQSLNIGIYKAIGATGVYYGTKLGHKVPWVERYPFNVVSHPQYVGSVMSILGLYILTGNQLPGDAIIMLLFWTCLYIVTGLQEHFC